MLIYKNEVMQSLRNRRESNINALNLKELMNHNWEEISLGFTGITMFWSFV